MNMLAAAAAVNSFLRHYSRSGMVNMSSSREVFVALGYLYNCSDTIEQTHYNKPTEHNMTTLLAQKMFTN